MGKVEEQGTKNKKLTEMPLKGPYQGYRNQRYYSQKAYQDIKGSGWLPNDGG